MESTNKYERMILMGEAGVLSFLALGGFFLFLGIFVLIAVIVFYVFYSYGLYKMGQKQKIELSWLAFIPFAQFYVMGKLIPDLKIFGSKISSPELVLPIASIVCAVLRDVRLIGWLISLAYLILLIASYYQLFRRYKGETALGLTIISVILLFIPVPFIIFGMRNADPVEPGEIKIEA